MRQLTYYIPLERMTRTSQIEAFISKTAFNLNGSCIIKYETLHTEGEIFSLMVVTLFTSDVLCDYIHRAMQTAIAVTLAQWSPDTDLIRVIDIPVAMRDFNAKEIL